MGRGKNPEETRQKILQVAKELFLEKGYDNTSINDIIDGLGGMTKGVIYHHFDSKFDILQQIIQVDGTEQTTLHWQGKTGLEKLQNSLIEAFTHFEKQKVAYSAAITLRSPRLLGEQYLNMFKYAVPEIQALVEEGMADGSIETAYPEEVADLIVLTLNTWLGFQSATLSQEELIRKFHFIKLTFDGIGIPLISEDVMAKAKELFSQNKKNS